MQKYQKKCQSHPIALFGFLKSISGGRRTLAGPLPDLRQTFAGPSLDLWAPLGPLGGPIGPRGPQLSPRGPIGALGAQLYANPGFAMPLGTYLGAPQGAPGLLGFPEGSEGSEGFKSSEGSLGSKVQKVQSSKVQGTPWVPTGALWPSNLS